MKNKFIFGAYANMAVNNFQQTINVIAEKHTKIQIRLNDDNCDKFMNSLFNSNERINNIEKIFSDKFLWVVPLLDKLGYKNADSDKIQIGLKECCLKFCKQMLSIRNFYTHSVHDPIAIGCLVKNDRSCMSFLSGLESIYDGALNEIKKRYEASEDDIAHLRRLRSAKDRTLIVRDVNDGFYYKLTNDNTFSEKGIAFFISLFLTKEYGYLFLKQLNGFKRGDDAKYRFTLETFTVLSTRPPVEKLKYEINDNLNLTLDLLNELSKVPIELFKTLSPANQQKYRYIEEVDEQVDVDEFTRSRIRHRSRFEYFALRYLDSLEEFSNIGFYTYLGNYHHKMYEKTVIDGQVIDRQLNFSLAGFCKNIDKNLIQRLEDSLHVPICKIEENQVVTPSEFSPYIQEVNPHYIVNNNNIGIKILTNGNDEFPIIDQKGAKMPTPDFWLSKYELPAMVFYTYLKTKNPGLCNKTVLDIIKERVAEPSHQVKIGEDNIVLISRKIRREIIWANTKLNEIDRVNQDSKSTFGKKQYTTLRAGVIAKILAKDIIELQPSFENGKDKITGANFQSLQRSLAYYESSRDKLYDIFKQASLLESNNQHPFLKQLFSLDKTLNHFSLQSFYKEYLLKRNNYFEEQLKKTLKGKVNFECYPLRKQQQKTKFTNVASLPIFLPRGLFDSAISELLSKTKLNSETKKERVNNSYLIKRYSEIIENCNVQPFYTEKRAYHFIDKAIKEEKKLVLVQKMCLSLEERKAWLAKLKPKPPIPIAKANEILEKNDMLYRKSYNEVCDNESLLRFIEIQDIVLFLISKSLLPKELTKGTKYNLLNIKGLLNTPNSFSVEVTGSSKYLIVADEVKIRDYGKVNSVKNDKKFLSLLNQLFNKPATIKYFDYLKENREYEKARVLIIQNTHLLESKMIEKFHSTLKKSEGGYYNFGNIIEAFGNAYPSYDINTLKNITKIRNKFSHNDYPDLSIVFDANSTGLIFVAKKFSEYYETKINEMIQLLDAAK